MAHSLRSGPKPFSLQQSLGWISKSEKRCLGFGSRILGISLSGFEDGYLEGRFSMIGYLEGRFSRMDTWKSDFPGWIPGARKWISGGGFLVY
jgi:hypothetical protein